MLIERRDCVVSRQTYATYKHPYIEETYIVTYYVSYRPYPTYLALWNESHGSDIEYTENIDINGVNGNSNHRASATRKQTGSEVRRKQWSVSQVLSSLLETRRLTLFDRSLCGIDTQ